MTKGQTQANRSKAQKKPSMSWAQALRDMVVSSINKGQLPIFGVFLVALMLIYKMPEQDVSKLVFEILESLRKGEFFSYIILCITLFSWFAHARYMSKQFRDESKRIGREKSALQSQLAGVKFKSSDNT